MAKITTLTVTGMAKVPHPNADYSSLGSEITLTCNLEENENELTVFNHLRGVVDTMVRDHIKEMYTSWQKKAESE